MFLIILFISKNLKKYLLPTHFLSEILHVFEKGHSSQRGGLSILLAFREQTRH
jgi:hypothetical protein